jgi:threonine/homoserine/homoserine lactone efflux protein
VSEDKPAVRLADQQEVLAAIVGIVLWVVALVVLVVFFRHDLQRHDTTWWYWSCGFGLVLGLYGLRAALRRRGR